MSAYQLRQMQSTDLPAVNHILSEAFTAARLEEGHRRPYVPQVHLSFLEMYRSSLPAACLVMEHKHNVIGYAFAHLWGGVGWIGPVSLLPAYQGRHLGRELMQAVIQALQQAGAQVIGLETEPRSSRNIGFYSHLGFLPAQLSLDLVRQVPPVRRETRMPQRQFFFHSELSAAEAARTLEEAEALAQALDPCLRIRHEIGLIQQFRYGDTLYLRAGDMLVACVLAHTETYSPEETARHLRIVMLLVHPQYTALLAELPALLLAWAEQQHNTCITVRTPTRYAGAYRMLLEAGFRVSHAELRMTLSGYHEQADPDHCNLMKWE
ncbi:MAG: GNAT family N-acetyltransferase [candidate division KSB1 bacterium]|nr:GNAT family N-acetyltransferase [candidate division KSB1 bacterium]MDZ7273170.1 GNAT family N-acetyltransferase [candidate division KSB1 bacterium]MDZ7285272.1 GNAT family N-acetyltransferase [candidate division KSB1 bacterium]MDZ7298304.1 GNAT family N-acetyltransferase [candidate division KSB1 bacterium]MDZ7307379.1 GNAT family N-acetyltransferase [candidate division KSB1 bacterium]